LYLKLKRIN